jgi:GT2 family glycosyltransferase
LASVSPDDEIIVVDNASTDGSADLVPSHKQVRLLRRATNNFIFGLNDGLAQADGRFVAFLNNDITVATNFVDEALALFDSASVFAVCPRILTLTGEDQGSLTSGVFHRGLWFYEVHLHDDQARGTFFAVGGQSFFHHEKLLEVGSIDPLLWPMYHEDIELSIRAWKAGYEIRYAPDALVYHLGSHASSRTFDRSELRTFVRQNEFLTVWKNATDLRFLLEHFAYLPFRLATAIIRRDWPTLKGFLRALSRAYAVRQARRNAKRHFRLSDGEVAALVRAQALGIRTPKIGGIPASADSR